MAPSAGHSNVAHDVHTKLRLVHKALQRSLHGIVVCAAQVLPGSQDDFILYCKTFRDCMMDHHYHEDAFLFPFALQHCGLEGPMEQLDAQHPELLAWLAAFSATVQACCKAYDGKELARAAADLEAHVVPHMEAEEALLTEEVFARAPASVLHDLVVKVDAHFTSTNPFKQLPFLVHNLTKQEAECLVFQGETWLFRKVTYPLLWSRVYRKVWRKFGSNPTDAAEARPQVACFAGGVGCWSA